MQEEGAIGGLCGRVYDPRIGVGAFRCRALGVLEVRHMSDVLFNSLAALDG